MKISEANCIFCELIKNETPQHCIYEDSLFIILLDKESLGFGHCIIIPKMHVSKIYELDDNIYRELFALAKKLSGILKNLPRNMYSPNYTAFANTGALAPIDISIAYTAFGSGIQHAHLHLVPHNNSDILINPSKYIKNLNEDELRNNTKTIQDFIKRN